MPKKWDFYKWDKYTKIQEVNTLEEHNNYQKKVNCITKDFHSLSAKKGYNPQIYYKLYHTNQ